MNVKVDIQRIEYLMNNTMVCTPVEIRIGPDEVEVQPLVADKLLQFQFVLRGAQLVMISRIYTGNPATTGEQPQVQVLYDFAKEG